MSETSQPARSSAQASTPRKYAATLPTSDDAPAKFKPEAMTPPADDVKFEHQDKKRKVDFAPQKPWMESPPIAIIAEHDGHEKTYFVHRELLAANSVWFSRLVKAEDNVLSEPVKVNARPEVFSIYFDWLYYGISAIDNINLRTGSTCSPALLCRTMHWLWLLGQTMDSERFQNLLLDNMHHRFFTQHLTNFRLPRLELIASLFHDATPTSHQELYRFYLDVVVNHGAGCRKHLMGQQPDFLAINRSSLAAEVFVDLACEFERHRDRKAALNVCCVARAQCDRFHRHEHTPPCYQYIALSPRT